MFPTKLLPSVLESAPDAMIVIDDSGTVLFANQQFTALFGFSHAEVIGQPIELLLPERFHARHVTHRRGFGEHERLRPMGTGQDLYARRRDGSEFPVEISLSPIHDAERRFVAAAIRDITDRKHAEAQIKAARTEADRANLAKSRFLATASHDLRQPLQALALLNGSLKRFVQDQDAQEALQEQEQAISAMARLLNALLDISKLESGAVQVEISDFDLHLLLEELRAEFAPLAQGKGLRLTLECGRVYALSDRTLLAQLLRNLIANALKYTDTGWIRITCRDDGVGGLQVDVSDSGIGISADHLPYVFDEFYRVGASTQSPREGYGLGLSIVQRIGQLLGLGVTADSEVGRGSRFSLRVPVGTAQASEGARNTGTRRILAPVTDQSCNILLVEDDPGVRKATRLFLHGEGYSVTTAASLTEALELADRLGRIDLVITDYHLGQERGTDVIAALSKARGQLKFILMTGDTSSVIRELPQDVHLRVISKPIDAVELLELVRSMTQQPTADCT